MVERESINFKLPKPLAAALRAAAKERNTTATNLVIQGLHHVLSDLDGVETNVETRLHRLEQELKKSVKETKKERLSGVEVKLEAIAVLSQRSSGRRQSYNYHPPQQQLQAYTGENLAKRLGVDLATLERELTNQTPKDFERWCRSRDPGSLAWRRSDNGLYHPVK